MAKDIEKSLHEKLKENSNNNTFQSSNIKQYVAEELKSGNENVIAESYSGYSKSTLTELSYNNKYTSKASPAQRHHEKERKKQKDTIGKE